VSMLGWVGKVGVVKEERKVRNYLSSCPPGNNSAGVNQH